MKDMLGRLQDQKSWTSVRKILRQNNIKFVQVSERDLKFEYDGLRWEVSRFEYPKVHMTVTTSDVWGRLMKR